MKITSKLIKDFDPRRLEAIRQQIGGKGAHVVNVGYPGGEAHEESDLTVAQIAAIHEFGAPSAGIPERPHLRVAIARNRGAYLTLNRQSVAQMLRGQMSMTQALGLLGEKAKADVQKEITNGNFAPLKAATIRRKGSSKPLIDSGQMRQSVTWEIKK